MAAMHLNTYEEGQRRDREDPQSNLYSIVGGCVGSTAVDSKFPAGLWVGQKWQKLRVSVR